MEQDIDYEKALYLVLGKVSKKFGDTSLLKSLNQSVLSYFKKEYAEPDYDISNIDKDICNIYNMFLNTDKYIPLTEILIEEDFALVAAIIVNELLSSFAM